MTTQLLPYVLPLLLTGLLMGVFVLMALPQRSVPGVRWFIVFTVAMVIWSLGYAAEFVVPGLSGKLLAAKIQYLGITTVPVAWLAFSVDYAGVSRWSRSAIVGILAIPMATLLLAWTNGSHGLVWNAVGLTSGHPYTVLELGHGVWFWVHVSFSYLYLLVATGLLIRVILMRPPLFRRQAVFLLLACLSPWLGNALYVTGLGPAPLDLTVFGFAISGILAGWAILRWKLLSIGPIARETIVESLSEGMVVVDREGRIVDVNPAAREILGLSSERVIGWDSREVLKPLGVVQDSTDKLRQTVQGPDGTRTYDYRVDPLRDRKGGIRGWTILLHDVTARAAEAEALQKARDLADETARAQRAFLTNINHEIRTPLNGVMGMLQLLLASDLDGEQKEHAEIAFASSEELLSLMASILEFTRLETGKVELEFSEFDFHSMVHEAVAGPSSAAGGKGLDFSVEIGPRVPGRVVADRTRLGQVVTCLAGNAVKFTGSGSVRVALSGEPDSGGQVRARVEVRDSGIGIPSDKLTEVFKSFVQADGSTTRSHEGAGLGLSIAHGYVAHMGGELQVSSQVGKGSTFWFEIPLQSAD